MNLKLEHIKKEIKSKVIIEEFSVEISEGEVCVLIGPNGAGKSTIMKIMSGLIEPDSGRVTLNGKTLDCYKDKENYPISCMIEVPEMYTDMTAMKNLQIQALQKHICKDNIGEVCQKALKESGLVGLENRKVKTYSLGMKQRLGIAMCLMGKPQIIIFDEPMNGLDPDGIEYVRNLLKRLKKEGISVIISSHILKEMNDVCDTFIFIKNGKIKKRYRKEEQKEDLDTLYKKIMNEEESYEKIL